MSETSTTQKGLMKLSRELRDQIYDEVLTTRYVASASPAVQSSPEPLPSPSTLDQRVTSQTQIMNGQHTRHFIAPLTPYYFEIFYPRLGILQTSSQIYQEALQTLYERSTFVFGIAGSRYEVDIESMNLEALKPIQNFELHLLFVEARSCVMDPFHQKLATAATLRLISLIANSGAQKGTCTIRLHCPLDSSFLRHIFGSAVATLKMFKTIVLKIKQQKEEHTVTLPTFPYTTKTIFEGHLHEQMDEMLTFALGPSQKGPDNNGYYVLTYHPQGHVKPEAIKSS